MLVENVYSRLSSKWRRLCADHCFRRPFAITADTPVISFTFDDFPLSSLTVGGAVLKNYGYRGTYYVSLDLAGRWDSCGQMFSNADLPLLRSQGHELGCHTFSHDDSSTTDADTFLHSVSRNRTALESLLPGASFRSFSFPKSAPRARTKRRVGARFECCRGGGQTFNTGIADLNYLRAFFLEQARGMDEVKQIIDRNAEAKGWLIFATHDVCDQPSPYGCKPEFFESTVRYVAGTGALVLPVAEALGVLRRSGRESHQELAR